MYAVLSPLTDFDETLCMAVMPYEYYQV